MSLSAGSRLGPYAIVAPLGAGGMGEVYKATDTRLNRTVAVKVLPPDLAGDEERRQRFEREARLIASLNHPHICAVHDVGSQALGDGEPVAYLVMEYLEGETLAERLARGPLPLTESMRIGAAIAGALAAAHSEQIVHRDLKPANVMLTKGGVKLLDFGIAKAVPPATRSGGTLLSTKAATLATSPGTTPGTVPYMSPEQLEGRAVDARSDMFALGAVLYEMATGTRAFPGDSFAALASAILTATPPPIAASPALDRIVRTCLDKDPERRWQSAHDVALQLTGIDDRVAAAEASRPRRALQWLPWAIALSAIAVALAALVAGRRDRAVTTGPAAFGGVAKFAMAPPPVPHGFLNSAEHASLSVSPDGAHIAFSTINRNGDTRVWVRPLTSLDARPLEGTEGGTSMFWSPDGRSLAFFAGGKLKRVDIGGDRPPLTICDVQRTIGQMGTWGADGTILFASVQGETILKVSASGGTPVEFIKPDAARREKRTMAPSFLPDGRSFLYTLGFADDTGAVMLAQPGAAPRELARVKSNARYVEPGYVLFVQESTLIARRLDASTGSISGDPISVATPVSYFHSTGIAHFSASFNGVIAYQSHQTLSRIASFSRSGKELAGLRPPAPYLSLRLSESGRQLLFDRIDVRTTTYDIHLLELDRGAETQITSEPSTEVYPLWAPDDALIYAVARGGPPRLHRHSLDTGRAEPLGPDVFGLQQPTDISRDGQWLLYSQRSTRGDYDIHALHLTDGKVVPVRDSTFNETDGRFSPDGRHVAFVSNERGNSRVYVMPFQQPGVRRAVTSEEGSSPRWSRDGRDLFYVEASADEAHLTSVPMTLTPVLTIGKPTRLFSLPPGRRWVDFAPMPDGNFIALQNVQFAGLQPLTIVVNWPASLPR
jgi:eukaryotic-like serine/threonine-protein kinase